MDESINKLPEEKSNRTWTGIHIRKIKIACGITSALCFGLGIRAAWRHGRPLRTGEIAGRKMITGTGLALQALGIASLLSVSGYITLVVLVSEVLRVNTFKEFGRKATNFFGDSFRISKKNINFDFLLSNTTMQSDFFSALDTSVQISTIREGDQSTYPQNGQTVQCHYVLTLENGKIIDNSRDRGKPFEFKIGKGEMIKGWDEGVAKMSVGQRAKLTISSDLAYGAKEIPGTIPGNSTLIFDVELLAVK